MLMILRFATTKWRGAMMAAVFAMQGIGQLVAALIMLFATLGFRSQLEGAAKVSDCTGDCRVAVDKMWRTLVGCGAVPACIALYCAFFCPLLLISLLVLGRLTLHPRPSHHPRNPTLHLRHSPRRRTSRRRRKSLRNRQTRRRPRRNHPRHIPPRRSRNPASPASKLDRLRPPLPQARELPPAARHRRFMVLSRRGVLRNVVEQWHDSQGYWVLEQECDECV